MFKSLFNPISSRQSNQSRNGVQRNDGKRRLTLESLENRELLSVSPTDFASIQSQYADLELTNYADYHIIEIEADNLTANALRNAITEAGTTTQNDIIVVRTTATQNKITLSGTELGIDVDASQLGSVTIVSLGTNALTIDANNGSRVFDIGSTSTVALAGLTITKGSVNPTNMQDVEAGSGGGIRNYGTLMVAKCELSENVALYGGAGIGNKGSLTVTNSSFTGNSAGYGGGGIGNLEDGILTVTHCEFIGNKATGIIVGGTHYGGGFGAGIGNSGGTLSVTDSIIKGNESREFGGGVANNADGTVTIKSSTITENKTNNFNGGGISNDATGIMTLIDSNIVGNMSGLDGGGLDNAGDMKAINCLIAKNTAAGVGAGIFGSIEVVDNVPGYMQIALTNCTITGNSATGNGGGIYNDGNVITLNNTIVDGAISGTISGNNNLTSSALGTGTGNIVIATGKPLFVNAAQGNYRLAADSQAIDKGNNALAVDTQGTALEFDLDGNARIVNTTVDIGAYEYSGTVVVDPPGAPTNASGVPSTTSVSLSWTAPTTGGTVANYKVETWVRNAADTDWVKSTITDVTSTATSANVTGLTPETKYQFRIYAVNSAGNSTNYAPVEKTTTSGTVVVPPSAPTGLNSTGKATNSVTLAWTAATGATGYVVQYRDNSINGSSWTSVAEVSGTTTTVPGLKAATQYVFQVRAVNSAGNSDWAPTEPLAVMTDSVPANVEPAVKVTKPQKETTINSIKLSWTDANAAPTKNVEYEIRFNDKVVATVAAKEVLITSAMMKSIGVSAGIEAAKTYKFVIRSKNAEGSSFDKNGKDADVKVTAKTPKYNAPKIKVEKTLAGLSNITATIKDPSRPVGETLTLQVENGRNNWVSLSVIGATASIDGNTITINDLAPTKKYKFRLEGETDSTKTSKATTFSASTVKFKPTIGPVTTDNYSWAKFDINMNDDPMAWTSWEIKYTISGTGTLSGQGSDKLTYPSSYHSSQTADNLSMSTTKYGIPVSATMKMSSSTNKVSVDISNLLSYMGDITFKGKVTVTEVIANGVTMWSGKVATKTVSGRK